ncbi:MAG: hypothetical protein GX803_08915 [Lentisphaerae bacterium]|jgi:hypothetical protein|nr:hypothetical protein [Lentisphaerota bacterium]
MNSAWKLELGQFVDDVRRNADALQNAPRFPGDDERLRALAASTAEALAAEQGTEWVPEWAVAIPPLKQPWFVSGVESLKAIALVESPVYFRRRNIFVLGNFLSRA